MQKVASIFLILLFLSGSMGIAVNSHYCGRLLRSVSIAKTDCSCEGKMPKGCCRNVIKYVKIADDFSSPSGPAFQQADLTPAVVYYCLSSPLPADKGSCIPLSHSPPPRVEKFVEFHSFLI